MNEENGKLIHSILGAIATWILAGISWVAAHAGLITSALAAIATIYSIQASRETIKLRRKQQSHIEPDSET